MADYDRNGQLDYWTRDVAGFHCIHDTNGRPLYVIDRSFASADRAPGMLYPELQGMSAPKQGYFFQAMIADENGKSYIDAASPAPRAKNVPPGPCTNQRCFGFVAYPAVYGSDGVLVFIVNEDGIIWQKDLGVGAPVLDRKDAAPGQAGSGWAQFGG